MNQRRARRPGEAGGCPVAHEGGLWRLRSFDAARTVLRARHLTTQAGFTAEKIPQGGLAQRPILIADGPGHDEQRRQVARFFAPTVVEADYVELMTECADRLVTRALAGGEFRMEELALHYAVEVTAHVVGLTHDAPGDTLARRERRIRAMSRRLVSFFRQPPFDLSRDDLGRTPRQWAQAAVNGLVPIATYWWCDVRPALRQRRRRRRDDVLSHLIDQGATTTHILIEAVTYGTAGMVTTREFIAMAAWHLLTDDALRARYLSAEREERFAVLHELIRLEPPVGHLYRRVQGDVVLPDGTALRRGDLVDVDVRAANTDPAAVGDEPDRVCPHRDLAPGIGAAGLTFGDGAHKCPGQPLAIWEADVLLRRLLPERPVLVRQPWLGWDDLIAGYLVRDFVLARRDGSATSAP